MNQYEYENYLMHYGVKGMKWGHRKRQAFSAKAAGHRFSAKTMGVYEGMNRKLGNKTSANAFKQVKEGQLKKAEQAQADANARKEAKNTPEAKAARRKTAIKVGAAVAGTALAAYGAYKVGQAIKDKNFKLAEEKGSKAFDDYIKDHYADRIGSTIFKDGTSRLDVHYGNGNSSYTMFKDNSANDYYNKLKLRNLEVEREAGDIYSGYLNRASQDSFKNATKNVANHYTEKAKEAATDYIRRKRLK